MQDGVRPDGGGGCRVAGAGDPGVEGGGCVYHADSDVGEHECALYYDWGEGGGYGFGGCWGVKWRAGAR